MQTLYPACLLLTFRELWGSGASNWPRYLIVKYLFGKQVSIFFNTIIFTSIFSHMLFTFIQIYYINVFFKRFF